MDKKIKLAIIGIGHVSDFQLEALKWVTDLELIAACDTDPAKAEKLPNGVLFFEDIISMLKLNVIEAVFISTPNKQHFSIAQQVLNIGKDVLLEKPATSAIGEFDHLCDQSKKSGCLLVIAFHAAFAKDLLWFKSCYLHDFSKKLGSISGFSCGFYDPYIENGKLLPNALSLGGSWTDSGINALSVVGQFVDANSLEIEDSRLTTLPPIFPCSELQGTLTFTFSIEGTDKSGRGCIDTNWTLGINCKFTRLYFSTTNHEIVLDHSNQAVYLIEPNGVRTILVDLSDKKARLVNHYIGVFEDFAHRVRERNDNLNHARRLHELLFAPYVHQGGVSLCR